MKFKVLGCYGGNTPGHGLTSFLVNDSVALDAGFITGALPLKDQVKIKDIMISHSHLDHTAALPFIIDNNFAAPGFALRIYAIPEVVASLKNHLFNNHTWPDFTCLPNDLTPVLRLVEITEEQPFQVSDLTIRAVRVSHIIPTTGFIVEDGKSSIAFTSDTAPTHRIWEVINKTRNLKAVITEVSFPDEMVDLANVSGHLTPASLEQELKKLKKKVPVYLYGPKPKFVDTIRRQVKALGLGDKRVKFLTQGKSYKF